MPRLPRRTDPETKAWLRDRPLTAADEHAIESGYVFRESFAAHAVEFFPKFLRHSKGQWAGQPFDLLDWQRDDVIAPLFGWVKKGTALRRFRRSYIQIPKKNGKSTLASGVGLYLLLGDGEEGAEVYSAATSKEQASIVHGEAIRMVNASPALLSNLVVNNATRNIRHAASRSWYRALSHEAGTAEGLNWHGLVVDELHAWKGRSFWNTLRYGARARTNPLLFVITTAGDDEDGVCYDQSEYARNVLDGTFLDPRFFAYVCEADQDDDWTALDTWRRVNPSMGTLFTYGSVADDIDEAKRIPSEQGPLCRYGLNIWGVSSETWIQRATWTALARPWTLEQFAGRRCWGGLDLAKTSDTTAFALIFRDPSYVPDEDEVDFPDAWVIFVRFWLPRDAAKREDRVPYEQYQAEGSLRLTEGPVCDYSVVEDDIVELVEPFDLRVFAYDPYNAEMLTQRLADRTGVERFSFGQTIMKFTSGTKELERLAIGGKITHDGDRLLTWQVQNTKTKHDVNANIRPIKPKPGDFRKIDGVVAGIMALTLAEGNANPDNVEPSFMVL